MAATEAAARRTPRQTSWSFASSLLHEFSLTSVNWLVFSSVSSIEMMAFYSMPVLLMPSSTGVWPYPSFMSCLSKSRTSWHGPKSYPTTSLRASWWALTKSSTTLALTDISLYGLGVVTLSFPFSALENFYIEDMMSSRWRTAIKSEKSKNARWLIGEIKLHAVANQKIKREQKKRDREIKYLSMRRELKNHGWGHLFIERRQESQRD